MATKSFLKTSDLETAKSKIRRPSSVPDGEESKLDDFDSLGFSEWLGEQLLARLSTHPEWENSKPIALGSWARGELAPKSDIDLLFVGPEESVAKLVGDFSREGLKLRSRTPEDPNDWTKGVLPFDIVALFSARPLAESAKAPLEEEFSRLMKNRSLLNAQIAAAIKEERKERAARFDSIANYLEPNLKYGPGGLRDLEQAFMLHSLFPERFDRNLADASARDVTDHAFKVLQYYKRFFLLVRQKLHLSEGGGEILAAPEQAPIAAWLGFANNRDFMREIQKGVSRVNFYADWVLEQALKPKAKIKKVNERNITTVRSLFDAIEEDPSVLMQKRIRRKANGIFKEVPKADVPSVRRLVGKRLTDIIDPKTKEAQLIALFRSRLIDNCVPEFKKIVGHVQHDQYHRFSVDAHILQALREVKRVRQNPGVAGKMKSLVKKMDDKSWEILSFACLYHDIAKGRQGDHSVEGKAIAREDLTAFGKSKSFIDEVEWIVEEHLILSAAAFRENSRSPRTWQHLNERGVKGDRLSRLAIFTIVDIRATNPEAWTPWKERLLSELVSQLEKPETGKLLKFAESLKANHVEPGWAESLDPFLIAALPETTLAKDLKVVTQAKGNEAPLVIRTREGRTWVRFHSKIDRRGLFVDYVTLLSRAGLSIRHASIYTHTEAGVYDWFEVKSSKTPAVLMKLLGHAVAVPIKEVKRELKFDRIEIVRSDPKEWVISFRGKDQSGALLEAARALFENGAAINWAKVHTWGKQIDDIFSIEAVEGMTAESFQKVLQQRLI